MFHTTGNQRFAYRFSGADFAMKIQADQILPELGVSQVRLSSRRRNELAVDAEIQLDVHNRSRIAAASAEGYAIRKLTASGMNDYFVSEPADANYRRRSRLASR